MIGTDEAGYGPNLGPLVIGCTVWQLVLDETSVVQFGDDPLAELERRLGPIVAETPSQLGKNGKILLIGDSKKLYQTGKLQTLTDSVLTVLGLCDKKTEKTPELFSQFDQTVIEKDSHATESIKQTLCQIGVSLCDLTATMISPREFNRQLEHLGNKSTILSEATLTLVKNAICALPDRVGITVLCDKHGGRNRYADMLYQFFPDDGRLEIVTEGTPLSVYRFKTEERTIEFRFQAKADRHIPAALASMTAKLLRELAMLEFNRFWQQYLPDLRPTAGYPVDALRFFGQIDETRKKLRVPKSDIWREK